MDGPSSTDETLPGLEPETELGPALLERALGPDHPELALALAGAAALALEQSRPTDAIRLAERTLGMTRASLPPAKLAALRFVLARAQSLAQP